MFAARPQTALLLGDYELVGFREYWAEGFRVEGFVVLFKDIYKEVIIGRLGNVSTRRA